MATDLMQKNLAENVISLYSKNGQTVAKVAQKLHISKELVNLIITEYNNIILLHCQDKIVDKTSDDIVSNTPSDCLPIKCATCPILPACKG